jgi:hypothetical protein
MGIEQKSYIICNTKYSMIASSYVLPLDVLEIIRNLETLIIIPPQQEERVERTANQSSYRTLSKPLHEKGRGFKKPITDNWNLSRMNQNSNTFFKPTKIEISTEGVEKDIQNIRTSLNKLSTKNYAIQKEEIIKIVAQIETSESSTDIKNRIAHFVFDVASANKLHSELYAQLYEELIERCDSVFVRILHDYIVNFKKSIETISYCDPNTDYDGFCVFVKENEKRRALSTFLVMLVQRNVLPIEMLLNIITDFQSILKQYLVQEGKVHECEELTELLYIIISRGKSNTSIHEKEEWNTIIVPRAQEVSKLSAKDNTYPSLSSRIIFKHLDILESCKK